jgi:four helix bundle protein
MPFRFETLRIWKQARQFSAAVYGFTSTFPGHEAFGLTSQLNRASNAIALLIAEGSALLSEKRFLHRLGLAQGELAEVMSGALLALDRKYSDAERHLEIYELGTSLARQIDAMRSALSHDRRPV